MKNIDFQLNSDYDLLFAADGGIAVGNVLEQNQALLLLSHEGEWKEYPKTGIGLTDVVNDENLAYWKGKIQKQLEDDGMRVEILQLTETGLQLEAKYQ